MQTSDIINFVRLCNFQPAQGYFHVKHLLVHQLLGYWYVLRMPFNIACHDVSFARISAVRYLPLLPFKLRTPSQCSTLQVRIFSDLPQVQPLMSTPIRTIQKFHVPKNWRSDLKAMVINCNSLKTNKQPSKHLSTNITQTSSLVVGANLTAVCPPIPYFRATIPSLGKIDANGGGVFIATRDTLVSSDLPDFDSICEVIWANLHFAGSKPLIFAIYCGPQPNKTAVLEELTSSVSKIINKNRRTQSNLIIGGDFNYPEIDWSSWKAIKASTVLQSPKNNIKDLCIFVINNLVYIVK